MEKKFLMVRASADVKSKAQKLAVDYGVSVSELVRLLLYYADEVRPVLTGTYKLEAKSKQKGNK